MGDSNLETASVSNDIIRLIFSTLDRPAYWLLGLVYQLFFNVASADLFSNGTILAFYKRIQLIIGVYMMFHLAMIILKGIVNPDTFTDAKTGGVSIIKRIAISLILLTVLVPISIPGAKNEWERQLNNNGLLFGALYSLQHRILNNNTLGRLILGTNDSAESFTESDPNDKDSSLARSSRIFTSTILKGFYRINLIPEEERTQVEGKDDATLNENRVCKDIDDVFLSAYTRIDADPGEIISLVNATCDADSSDWGWWASVKDIFGKISGSTHYIFAYTGFISMIVPFIFVFILLSFTVDVAVRAVKLSVLRLIAPIPIISYMDPKGGKDGSFAAWGKALTSTYLDLFIRLAVVYFVIFLIQDMIVNGIVINTGTGVLGILSMILIWIGLFIFAKQAPKFIKQVLGVKDEGGKLFGGFGELAAVGSLALGTAGSASANYRASREENAALHEGSAFNGFRNVGSAIAGAIGGGYAGTKAFMSKDSNGKSVRSAMDQRNTARAAHSTLPGQFSSTLYGLTHGQSLATRDQSILDANKAAASSIKTFKSTAVDEAMKKGTWGNVSTANDRFGRLSGINFNYRQLEAAMNTKDTSGNFDYTDASGTVHHLNAAWFDSSVMADIEDSQTANYLRDDYDAATGTFANGKINTDWRTAKHDMSEAKIAYRGNYLGDINAGSGTSINGADYAYKDIGKSIGTANSNVADMSTDMRHIMNRANSQNKK